jgi:spore germination cell wall hydrolase CwlJ-like protein
LEKKDIGAEPKQKQPDQTTSPTQVPTAKPTEPPAGHSVIKKFTITAYSKDAEYIAKTIWGEARGCSPNEQAKVAWCILNRVDNGRFGKNIIEVITAPKQFIGYSYSNPVTDEHYKIAIDTIEKWKKEKSGEVIVRELEKDKLYFSSDGKGNNIFR